ncbi:hypothetical protein SESBI_17685 [Sesbania bispinosa]|nr:hypothetical protein SESBI_17685 [Sesbania bispinosa]
MSAAVERAATRGEGARRDRPPSSQVVEHRTAEPPSIFKPPHFHPTFNSRPCNQQWQTWTERYFSRYSFEMLNQEHTHLANHQTMETYPKEAKGGSFYCGGYFDIMCKHWCATRVLSNLIFLYTETFHLSVLVVPSRPCCATHMAACCFAVVVGRAQFTGERGGDDDQVTE